MKVLSTSIKWLVSVLSLAVALVLLFQIYSVLQMEAASWVPNQAYLLAFVIFLGACCALLFFAATNPIVSGKIGWSTAKKQVSLALVALVSGGACLAGMITQYDRMTEEGYKMERLARAAAEEAIMRVDIESYIESFQLSVLENAPEKVFDGTQTFDREIFAGSIFRGSVKKPTGRELMASDMGLGPQGKVCAAIPNNLDKMTMKTKLGNEVVLADIKEAFDASEDTKVQFLVAEMHRLCRSLTAKPDQERGYAILAGLANNGDMTAQALVGLWLRDGIGQDADAQAALNAIKTSADAGNPLGLALLGDAYEFGLGELRTNKMMALSSYTDAAAAGQLDAAERLSMIHAGEVKGYRFNAADLPKAVDLLCGLTNCRTLVNSLQDKSKKDKQIARRYRAVAKALCDDQSAVWCTNYAIQLENGRGGPADHVNALKFAEIACELNQPTGCFNGAVYARTKKGKRRVNYTKARALALKGCELGRASSCVELANRLKNGQGGKKDLKQARAFYDKGCKRESFSGCAVHGDMAYFAEGGTKSFAAARASYAAGCEGDDAYSCYRSGLMSSLGQGQKTDQKAGRRFQKKACDLNYPRGCYFYGNKLRKGEGGPKDMKAARIAYKKACDGNDASGCAQYGDRLRKGEGGPKVLSAARAAYLKACNGGNISGCALYADRLQFGEGGKTDFRRARVFYKKACDGKDLFACAQLGRLMFLGRGGPKDITGGRRFMTRACNGNDGYGCEVLGLSYNNQYSRAATEARKKACRLGRKKAC